MAWSGVAPWGTRLGREIVRRPSFLRRGTVSALVTGDVHRSNTTSPIRATRVSPAHATNSDSVPQLTSSRLNTARPM